MEGELSPNKEGKSWPMRIFVVKRGTVAAPRIPGTLAVFSVDNVLIIEHGRPPHWEYMLKSILKLAQTCSNTCSKVLKNMPNRAFKYLPAYTYK